MNYRANIVQKMFKQRRNQCSLYGILYQDHIFCMFCLFFVLGKMKCAVCIVCLGNNLNIAEDGASVE